MEYYVHIFPIFGSQKSQLLRLNVILLQWQHCNLLQMFLRLPKQHGSDRKLHWVIPSNIITITTLKIKLKCVMMIPHINPTCCWFYRANSHYLSPVVSNSGKNFEPLVQCTSHMCPIRVHWHIKLNYREYWRVKITITNFNYRRNYSDWNLVIQHPNLSNVTKIFSFNYKSLAPYATISKILSSIFPNMQSAYKPHFHNSSKSTNPKT